jgi:hypothetical protein
MGAYETDAVACISEHGFEIIWRLYFKVMFTSFGFSGSSEAVDGYGL